MTANNNWLNHSRLGANEAWTTKLDPNRQYTAALHDATVFVSLPTITK